MSCRKWTWLSALLVVTGVLVGLAVPWDMGTLTSHAQPVLDCAEAADRVQLLQSDQQSKLNPDCVVQLMTHGRKVERAAVLVHGFASCPLQFQALGDRLYALGYNVLMAPLPRHGLADRMTNEQSHLTASELAAYADEMLDIAQGLGSHVVMMGLSGGGVVTGWAAQNRPDLNTAVLIAPGFGFKAIPTPLTAPTMNLYAVLPEAYVWWDPVQQENLGPSYDYPRYSQHALTQILRLSFSVQSAARREPPAASRIILVLNGAEPSVNNGLATAVAENWQQHTANVLVYEFPSTLQLPHDMIDPLEPGQNVEVVYAQLIDLITR